MPANKIMIVRHAEKPVHKQMRGVRANGKPDEGSLTTLGWQRAGALAVWLGSAPRHGAGSIERPAHLFAARFDPESDDPSRRSKQTLKPLAAKLQIDIDHGFAVGDEAALLAAMMRCRGAVLVAWEHHAIAAIGRAFPGCGATVPGEWPDDRFDLVWVFERTRARWSFTQRPQLLLAGDRRDVVGRRSRP